MSEEKSKQEVRLYFVHAHSPLHVGVGEGLGAISLPTAREVATQYPYIPGSSVKGILRDAAEQQNTEKREIYSAFGPPKEHAGDARGGLVISDASLLCLPVRSLVGTFAWVTCPLILRRLARDGREAYSQGVELIVKLMASSAPAIQSASSTSAKKGEPSSSSSARSPIRVVPSGALITADSDGKRTLFLEDMALRHSEHWEEDTELGEVGGWLADRIWPGETDAAREEMARDTRKFFLDRLLLVPDDLFSYLHRYSTEVRNRVKIDAARGTAADSGPWAEEYLPAETLFFGVVIGRATIYVNREKQAVGSVGAAPVSSTVESFTSEDVKEEPRRPQDVLGTLDAVLKNDPLLRLGGKSTGGSGRVHLRVAK